MRFPVCKVSGAITPPALVHQPPASPPLLSVKKMHCRWIITRRSLIELFTPRQRAAAAECTACAGCASMFASFSITSRRCSFSVRRWVVTRRELRRERAVVCVALCHVISVISVKHVELYWRAMHSHGVSRSCSACSLWDCLTGDLWPQHMFSFSENCHDQSCFGLWSQATVTRIFSTLYSLDR